MNYKLNIAWLYPDLMSTYGDRGNIIALKRRCEWRGIDADIKEVTLETTISKLKDCDLVFMGGAQDRQQKIANQDFLENKAPKVKEMIEKGIPCLFVCAAYQFVGHYYRPYQGKDIPGAGIFDLYTHHPGNQAKRLIGNTIAEIIDESIKDFQMSFLASNQGSITHHQWIPHHFDKLSASQVRNDMRSRKIILVGFENHGGRTYLGKRVKPLAKVIKGYGNNGEDGLEGAIFKNAIGSYFHGPILPKNPYLADWLIIKALEVKYRKEIELKPLDDELEEKAHDFIIKKLRI